MTKSPRMWLTPDVNNNKVAEAAGVNKGTMHRVGKGTQGLSLESSRAVCKSAGLDTPLHLYMNTQVSAIKHRAEEGDAAAALRGAAAVVDQLQKLSKAELALEATEVGRSIAELDALLSEIFGDYTPAGGSKPAEKTRPKRDTFGRRVPDDSGDHERDAHGRKLK